MRVLVSLFAFSIFILAESFITDEEYGKYLYSNPRGISCLACHGEFAQGKIIASYIDKGVKKILKTQSISDIDYKSFSKALKKSRGVMPRYYLSDKETKILFDYIQTISKDIKAQE